MKHRLVPIAREPVPAEQPYQGWRCVWCGRRWSGITADVWFEECPGSLGGDHAQQG